MAPFAIARLRGIVGTPGGWIYVRAIRRKKMRIQCFGERWCRGITPKVCEMICEIDDDDPSRFRGNPNPAPKEFTESWI
jgi:hypothetical protein